MHVKFAKGNRMEQMNYKELDNRIHTFLNRKFAELATVERIPRASSWKNWRFRPKGRQVVQHWGRA